MYREIDYVKFQKKKEQHNPLNNGTTQDLCMLYANFRCDLSDFLLRFRIELPEWQTLIMSLKMDKIVLEVCLLRSVYQTLCENTTSPFFSELLVMSSLLAITRGKIPNDSEEGVNSCDKTLWMYPLFLNSYTRCDPIEFLQLDRPASMERFSWHLICDNWIKNLKFKRIVRSGELKNFKMPLLPNPLQLQIIRVCNRILPDGKVFSIDTVKKHFSHMTSVKV